MAKMISHGLFPLFACILCLILYIACSRVNNGSAFPIVEEYEIGESTMQQSVATHERTYQKCLGTRVSEEVLKRRMRWRDLKPDMPAEYGKPLENYNKILSKTGFRLEPSNTIRKNDESGIDQNNEYHFLNSFLRLTHNGRTVIDSLRSPYGLASDRNNQQFLFVADHLDRESRYKSVLIHDSTVADWQSTYLMPTPLYFKGKILKVECDRKSDSIGGMNYNSISLGNDRIFSFVSFEGIAPSVQSLLVVDSTWVLEYTDPSSHLVICGVDIGKRFGYQECFGPVNLHGTLLYFIKLGGAWHLRYGDLMLPSGYDDIVHFQCCDNSTFNPCYNENMVWFYARRGGICYYVEVGIYK